MKQRLREKIEQHAREKEKANLKLERLEKEKRMIRDYVSDKVKERYPNRWIIFWIITIIGMLFLTILASFADGISRFCIGLMVILILGPFFEGILKLIIKKKEGIK